MVNLKEGRYRMDTNKEKQPATNDQSFESRVFKNPSKSFILNSAFHNYFSLVELINKL